MEIDFIPFKIGMQYENWEFDLEPIKFAKYFDKYKYIKSNYSKLLDINVNSIYLFFNLDILFRVEIIMDINFVLGFHNLVQKLNFHFKTDGILNKITEEVFEKKWKGESSNLYLQYYFKTKIIKLVLY
ncbi:hypothetical protein [Mesonia maritima]|uniref:Uncharacterized protein n=1 Tax=Mesonia maritima TaxID=1793873 RepID=A0ABU1K2T7_9FLAO|nr:hypothetical protein [Mesonia maritima]MDR6299918.1 hypothetical protein [Mesonia maritima]